MNANVSDFCLLCWPATPRELLPAAAASVLDQLKVRIVHGSRRHPSLNPIISTHLRKEEDPSRTACGIIIADAQLA